MADELLSQAELETLLNSLESGLAQRVSDSAGHALPAPHLSRIGAIARGPGDSAAGAPAEVAQQPPFGADLIAALRTLHEGFGRAFSAALSALLRSVVEVKLAWVEQITYGEFISRLQNPTCANVVRGGRLASSWILDLDPGLLFAMIDRLLGGGREPGLVARRPLTEIELRLASRVTQLFLEQLQLAWGSVAELSLTVDRVESNPRLILSVPSQETVVLVGFEAKISDVRGSILLCLPARSLACIAGPLVPRAAPSASESGRAAVRRAAEGGTDVEFVVHLAETRIPARDLQQLRVGDIIATEQDVRGPLLAQIRGKAAFQVRAGAVDGRKAVRIEDSAAPPAE